MRRRPKVVLGEPPLTAAERKEVIVREKNGRRRLKERGLVIPFGDPLTPDELRSIERIMFLAAQLAPTADLPKLLPGLGWLEMLTDAGASMLPRREAMLASWFWRRS